MSGAPATAADTDAPRLGDAEAGDAPALAGLMRVGFADPWSEDAIRRQLERGATRARVARGPDGRLLAYVLGSRVLDELQILSCAVDPVCRGRGIARALLEDYLGGLRREEVQRVTLEVRESNAAARALYRSLGFVYEGERRRFYPGGETALLLGLDWPAPAGRA